MGDGQQVRVDGVLDWLVHRRGVARWRRAAEAAAALDPENLRILRGQARALRRHLDRVLHVADARLARAATPGVPAIRRPPGADWAWRPDLWASPLPVPGRAAIGAREELGGGATLFHDCRDSEVAVRQVRNTRARDVAPWGLRIDVFRFDGSFLSLVLDLPEAGATGLRLRHVLKLDVAVETERPTKIFARLNVRHGPNLEQVAHELPAGQDEASVEYDLAYTRINEKRVEKAWIDLIFERPQMNQIVLRDATLVRRPRAAL